MTTALRLAAILSLCLAMIWGRMATLQKYDPPPVLVGNFRSPILAMELVRSPAEVRSLLRDPIGQHNRDIMRKVTQLDGLFIVAYCLYFLTLGLVPFHCRWPGATLLGLLIVLGSLLAAQWDVFENMGIFLVLDTPVAELNESMTAHIRTASLVKWGLLAFVEFGLAALFKAYGRNDPLVRILTTGAGLFFGLTGIAGLAGLYWNIALEWSALALSLGMLAALPVLLFAPNRFLTQIGAKESEMPRAAPLRETNS